MAERTVQVGDFIVVQRQNYTKLHKVSARESVMLGKDQINLGAIIGNPAWTTYKMVPKKNGKRAFVLERCDKTESLVDQLFKEVSSGVDNRNIFDDGRSQALSTEEIVGLRSSGLSGQEIVGQLIENSKTFRDKTEYSQEKYLKKKEKKYFEYVTIRWPTIRLISEIMFRMDAPKIMGLRMDTLSQITTAVGMQAHGSYVVYESGCQALVVAAMLNNISEGGHLVHVHPGNFAQKNAVSAMNFSTEQLSRLLQVNVYSLLRKLLQAGDSSAANCETTELEGDSSATNCETRKQEEDETTEQQPQGSDCTPTNCDTTEEPGISSAATTKQLLREESSCCEGENGTNPYENEKKRRHSGGEESESKKPRWELDVEKAADILRPCQMDGLVVAAREHPSNIVNALLPYIAPSRPIVVFCPCREPLLDLYVELKSCGSTVALHVTETWLRKHQILPSRTHPDIQMSGGGGYLLTGIVVDRTPQ